jgi:hypothetical protein
MNILVKLDFPSEVEQRLDSEERERLSAVAQKAIVIDLFRKGQLNHAQLGKALGLDRSEIEALLKRYQVAEHGLAVTGYEVGALLEFLLSFLP